MNTRKVRSFFQVIPSRWNGWLIDRVFTDEPNAGSAGGEGESLLPAANSGRSNPPTNPMIGPAVVAVVCCGCVLIGLLIAFMVWVVATLIFSVPSTGTRCGRLNHLWQYCMTVLVVMPAAALALNCVAYCTRMVGLTLSVSYNNKSSLQV